MTPDNDPAWDEAKALVRAASLKIAPKAARVA
jgi:hypothetical protein